MVQGQDDADARRGSHQDYPEDRFDRPTAGGRVGAHRFAARQRYVWQYLVAAAVGFVLLTGLGIIGVQSLGGDRVDHLSDGRPSAPASEEVEAVLDPAATVAVFNGTEIPNLAAGVDGVITANGWGQIVLSDNAAASDVDISAVFYAAPEDEAAAEGLAAELGGLSTYEAPPEYGEYGARLVVLLGADYQGPGIAEAEQMTQEGQSEAPPTEEALPEEGQTPEENTLPEGGEAPVQ
ncbi:LytR C-terminal domain-containing protein [Leucobacter sp. CSA1]|uniref:LytR C-terminal domain-containing protein n=1 Tax=Leucobacter chromiisoli TaxID=2796471 RepID=A0A934Q3I5_9MICO|nr:LytR C-terminal domain-containing protein [Leucobacter chromiisoli]MBK0417719.1 LytR C-terminal domain-containing protein [Leucobacter chromiisoli]